MKIGIFGGSFNPPHIMHENIASFFISSNYLDKVIFLPTGNYYNKTSLIDAKIRLDMLKILCKSHENFEVSDFEIKNKLVSTYMSLDHFRDKYPNDDIFFILGADNLGELDTWKRYQYLLENYKFLVIKRKGENIEELLEKYEYNKNIIVTDMEMLDVSSTEIREMIKKSKKEVYSYLDKKVYEYIKKNNIYK